jgi:hypothetical protein
MLVSFVFLLGSNLNVHAKQKKKNWLSGDTVGIYVM